MSDFQDAKTKRAIFAAMTAERELEQLRFSLIYLEDVDESCTTALTLLERISERWARDTAAKVARSNRDMDAMHAELSAAADSLLRQWSGDLSAMARAAE